MKSIRWLSGAFSRGQKTARTSRKRRAARLRLELLEDRTLLSAAPNQAFVQQIYLDLLQRPVDSGALAVWSGALQNKLPRTAMVAAITGSAEFRAAEVQELYDQYLHRPADPAGLKAFADFLATGGAEADVAAALAGSPEYFKSSGGAINAGFLSALYTDALGRDIPSDALVSGAQALAAGMRPKQMAAAVLGSAEYRQVEVKQLYQQLLRRSVDADGVQFFGNALAGGMHLRDVITVLTASPEYQSLTTGLQITALSSTSGIPGSLLTITGSGFDPTAQLAVSFTGNTNNTLSVPVLNVQPWQLTVAVPPFINLATGTSGAASVQVAIVQQSGGQTVTSTNTASFQIADLPQTGVAAGAWATAVISHAQAALQAAVQNLQQGAAKYHVDVSSLLTQVQTQQQKLATLSQELATVRSGQATTINLGPEGNVSLALNSSSLALIDRYLEAVFAPNAVAGQIIPRPLLPAMLRAQSIDPEQTVAASFTEMLQGGFDATKEFMLNFREHTETGLGLLGAALLLAPETPVVATVGALAALGSVGVWTATTFYTVATAGAIDASSQGISNGDLIPNAQVAEFVAKSGLDLIKTQATEVLKEVPTFQEATEYAEALEAGHDTVELFQKDAPVVGAAIQEALHPLPPPPPPAPTPPPPASFSDKVAGFIATTYIDLLHHSPDATAAVSWEAALNAGVSRVQMVAALTSSAEYRGLVVDSLYRLFLGRSGDAASESGWMQFLASGGTIEQIEAALAGSQEFYQVEGGGTEAGYLHALYELTLGRDVDPDAEAALENALDNGLTAAQIASVIANSPEALQDQVNNLYSELLHRPADATGLSFYVQQLESGGSLDGVIAGLMNTAEFFPLPPPPPPPPPPSGSPFAGAYSGSYSGSGSAFGFTAPVSGAVAFTVSSSGVISVTVPGAGTGTVSGTGSANFGAAGGGGVIQGATVSFAGTFIKTGNVVTASGTWTATFNGGSGSGTWTATRG